MKYMLGIITLSLLLSACALFNQTQSEERHARCKEIKKQIVFNGATSYDLRAQQERADLAKLNQDFRAEDC